jgi:hypothetical protein
MRKIKKDRLRKALRMASQALPVMIAKYVRKSLMFGGPGLLLQMGCTFVANLIIKKAMTIGTVPLAVLTGIFVVGSIAGNILFIAGLSFYAKAKGYSAVLGALGLLSCIGLLILALIPDRTKGMNVDAAT